MSDQNVGYSRHRAFKAMCDAKKMAKENTAQEQSMNFSGFMSGGLLKYEGDDMLLKFKEELLKKEVESFEEYTDRIFQFMARNIGMRLSMESADVGEFIHCIGDNTANKEELTDTIAILRDVATYFVATYFDERISLNEFMDKLEFVWWTYA